MWAQARCLLPAPLPPAHRARGASAGGWVALPPPAPEAAEFEGPGAGDEGNGTVSRTPLRAMAGCVWLAPGFVLGTGACPAVLRERLGVQKQ